MRRTGTGQKDAARVEPRLDELEELARVEHGRALHPRIEWIGGDRVELVFGGKQKMPRIVDMNADLRISDDVG